MKNLLKISAKGLSAVIAAGILSIAGTFSASGARNPDLDEMTFIEMVNSVDLGQYSDFIQKFQDKEARNKLLNGKYSPKSKCTVENFRNKEVLLITIPAELLFAPNETLLKDKAGEFLAPLKRYLKNPDTYRVLLVMHTDNTGSVAYRDELTEERVESVFEWFEEEGCDTSFLFPYAMGDEMKLKENDSQANRAANRRLEVYLMPGTKMIEQAKKGRIEF